MKAEDCPNQYDCDFCRDISINGVLIQQKDNKYKCKNLDEYNKKNSPEKICNYLNIINSAIEIRFPHLPMPIK